MRVPKPVRDFFADFLGKPDPVRQREVHIEMLERELRRAEINVRRAPALIEVSDAYRSDIHRAELALMMTWRGQGLGHDCPDLTAHWLTLLGHRLAVEYGLRVECLDALAHVASRRLGLPRATTEAWSMDMLYRQYTKAHLRAEWDYPGLLFRNLRTAGSGPPDDK